MQYGGVKRGMNWCWKWNYDCACVGYFQFLVIGWDLQVPRVECGGVRSAG